MKHVNYIKSFILATCFFCKLNASILDYIYPDSNSPTLNSFGTSGLIQLPSAESLKEGSIYFNYTDNNLYRFGSLTISPFSWLEASYFYYRPSDLFWKNRNIPGEYLDKGFSMKFSKNLISQNINLAIGMDDFAGSGFFSREYLMATKRFSSFKISTGIGWGQFIGDQNSYKNPLSLLSKNFNIRPSTSKELIKGTGNLAFDSWFRGPASLIGGIEIFVPKVSGMSFKLEIDPFNYREFGGGNLPGNNKFLRKKDSKLNLGVSKKIGENFFINLNYIKGNLLNLTFSFGGNWQKPFYKKRLPSVTVIDSQKGSTPKETFYEDLLLNINNKDVYMQTAELQDGDLKVSVSSSKYRDPIHIHSIVGDAVSGINSEISLPINSLTTIGINVGHELYQINTPIEYFTDREAQVIEFVKRESIVTAGEGQNYRSYEFRPTINYPASFTEISPTLINHIGDPAKFYFGGIVLKVDNELQLSSRLQINTEIHFGLKDNFNKKRNNPDSELPHVRTDLVSYLQESNSYISRMQIDYFFSPAKHFFVKLSSGILENMYSGAGLEMLFKPFNQNFSLGFEAYRAQKRDFDRKFNLLNYKVNTGHLNFNYHLPRFGILGTLSFGRYLAGDKGYTFDISRRLSSGFRAGFFFTRTNVSPELFGEGSFDKGFYFQIPIDLFLNDFSDGYTNFKLRPLTRDGGQKLEAGNDLIGIIHHSSRSEIERYWRSFHD